MSETINDNLIAVLSARRANGFALDNTGTHKHNRRQILATDKNSKYNKRRWSVPSKRAKGYAEERRSKVHQHGPKEGRELTDYEAGIRSGYLQCQTDHAGMYKYKKALTEGKSKAEAKEYSQRRGK